MRKFDTLGAWNGPMEEKHQQFIKSLKAESTRHTLIMASLRTEQEPDLG